MNDVEPPGATEDADTETPDAEERTPEPDEDTPESEETTAASTPRTGSGDCVDLTSAESVLLALQERGLPIGEYQVFTAEDDPNELLGRPRQYTSKVNFIDTTIGPGSSAFDLADGGSIEVFESTDYAQSRADYILGVLEANPSLVEYDFLEGTVLLRLSGSLTPDEAALYEEALEELADCTARN